MSRYTGPRLRKMRALGVHLPGLSGKTLERRSTPPGQHGAERRGKKSDYALQLTEKQKVRHNYGVTEKQMRRLMKECLASKVGTGDKLIELLERRLDSVVFRAGFARTIPAARQLVNHRHIKVNGRAVDIASYRIRKGDSIEFRGKSTKLDCVTESLEMMGPYRPDWLTVDAKKREVVVSELPDGGSAPFPVTVQLVVEYYSRLI
jgi:small subunit ribosomal protein S4